jgi:hypothetical protein
LLAVWDSTPEPVCGVGKDYGSSSYNILSFECNTYAHQSSSKQCIVLLYTSHTQEGLPNSK